MGSRWSFGLGSSPVLRRAYKATKVLRVCRDPRATKGILVPLVMLVRLAQRVIRGLRATQDRKAKLDPRATLELRGQASCSKEATAESWATS